MTWTPEELAILALSDKVMKTRGYGVGSNRPRRAGKLGTLTDAQAKFLHKRGLSRLELARAANVHPCRVSIWRNKLGLARSYRRLSGT